MMVEVHFNCDSASFADGFEWQLRRILQQVEKKVLAQYECPSSPLLLCDAPESIHVLLDINGNAVGDVKLHED